MHDLKKQSEPGHGSWLSCQSCGAAKHSGFWWFAGMKSKIEPPCRIDKIGQNIWLISAIKHTHDGVDGS